MTSVVVPESPLVSFGDRHPGYGPSVTGPYIAFQIRVNNPTDENIIVSSVKIKVTAYSDTGTELVKEEGYNSSYFDFSTSNGDISCSHY
ncbi:MAG: hypothetical protein KDD22_08990, partial [Bdellovibrionales bacterium]|nr:hypothetical protein [Bdellovibrionales bacterium]